MSAASRLTRAAANRTPLGDSFISPEEMEHLSVLIYDTEFPASGACPKSKTTKSKKVKAESTQPEASSSSVADLIQLELLHVRKENLTTQLKIAETELKLAQLNASSRSPEATGTTPSISPVKLQSAIEPNVSSSHAA